MPTTLADPGWPPGGRERQRPGSREATRLLLALLGGAAGAAAADAPGQAAELPPLTVVASPTQATTTPGIEQAREELGQVPGGATLITTNDYRSAATGSLSTFLAMVPGVFSAPEAGGQGARLSIRGSGIQSDGVLGVTLLQDGIPINEGDGEADIELFDLGAIQYAEVFRGADAMRYGALGLGGAINVVSLTGRDVGPLNGRIEGGSFGYHLEQVSSGGADGRWDWIIGADEQHSDGFRSHSDEGTLRALGSIGYRVLPDWEDRLWVSYIRLRRDLPDDLTKEQLAADPRQSGQDSFDQQLGQQWWTVRIADKLSIVAGQRSVEAGIALSHRWWHENDLYVPDDPQGVWHYESNGIAGNLTLTDRTPWFEQGNQLIISMLPNWESEPDHRFANDNGQPGVAIEDDRSQATNLIWTVEERHALSPHWMLLAGAQLVLAKRTYQDTLSSSPTYGTTNRQSFTGFNPKLGVIDEPVEKIQLYANLSRSFQPPSFDDLVQLGSGATPGFSYQPLLAESATTAEIGMRNQRDGMTWELSLYRSWIHHELLALYDQFGNDIGTVNASPTIHQGVEAALGLDLLAAAAPADGTARHLQFEQSCTFSSFTFQDDPLYGHDRIAGIPPLLYRASLIYQDPCGLYLGPTLEWCPLRVPVDEANTLYADPYLLLGARAGWQWSQRLRVFVSASNLTNRTYAAVVAPIADARNPADPAVFRPGNGRTLVGGVEASW
jgi:iron complex outermembrane receptor protein